MALKKSLGRVVSGDGYTAHPLHTGARVWPESNCYVDLCIELLHGRGLDPLAMLGCCLGGESEGDQFTFVKPPLSELEVLYGVNINELNVYRPLAEHVAVQVARGHTVIVEVDSFVLPDTRGTAYRLEHVKTAIGIDEIDVPGERIWYFHNAGRYSLGGEDYRVALQVDVGPEILPPYVELAKFRSPPLEGQALVDTALEFSRRHLRTRPQLNPYLEWASVVAQDVARLQGAKPADFHDYAFAWVRQAGAIAELAGLHLRWLGEHGVTGLTSAADAFVELAETSKVIQFKLARMANGKRTVDGPAFVAPLAEQWTVAMTKVEQALP